MLISIINLTHGKNSDEEIQKAVRAINRQISEDFAPDWGFGGQVRLEGMSAKTTRKQSTGDMRGDAVIYLMDELSVEGALAFHDSTNPGIPYSCVFTDLSLRLGEDWTVTLSHEVLEMLADPQTNKLVEGPHPEDINKRSPRTVFHWFEVCDAVQCETYEIDGVAVCNFVLPQYFTAGDLVGNRCDFLGRIHQGQALSSFGTSLGGYVGFYDPQAAKHVTWFPNIDAKAAKRAEIKAKSNSGRGNLRKSRIGRFKATRDLHNAISSLGTNPRGS